MRASGCARAGPTPVLLKIAPDLTLADLDEVVGIARKHRLDGMIVGNTTISRPGRVARARQSQRSGRTVGPSAVQAVDAHAGGNLCARGRRLPADRRRRHQFSATAIAKIKAGATLLQLYTGLVFRGIGVVAEIKTDIAAALKRGHRNSLASMVGADAADITAESWPA